MRDLYVKTEAATEPISIADAKKYVGYLGEDVATQDLIEYLLIAARLKLEHSTGRNFASKSMVLVTSDVKETLSLPFGPINEITSIKMYDSYGDLDSTLVEDEDFYLLGNFDKVIRFENFSLGSYMEIEYTSGYDDDGIVLPKPIRMAILRQTKYDYDNRGNAAALPILEEVKQMLIPYTCSFL